jgi:hypothetical protein
MFSGSFAPSLFNSSRTVGHQLNDRPADLGQDAFNLVPWVEQGLLARAAEGFVLVGQVAPKWLITVNSNHLMTRG